MSSVLGGEVSSFLHGRGLKCLQKLCQSAQNKEVVEYAALALQTLLGGNLSAKYALTGLLSVQDRLVETEFCDAGMAKSAEEFVPLAELLERQLSLSRPVFTVSLLARPPPPCPHPPAVAVDELSGKDESQVDLQASHKSKGRATSQQQHGSTASSAAGKGYVQYYNHTVNSHLHVQCVLVYRITNSKRQKGERHTDSRMSEESVDSNDQQQQQQQQQASHLLPADAALCAHIEHTKSKIQPLTSVTEQVKQAAMLVPLLLTVQQSI